MNNLNDLTLEQKSTIVKKARFRDRQGKSLTNKSMVKYLFDIEDNPAINLCSELNLYAHDCNGPYKEV